MPCINPHVNVHMHLPVSNHDVCPGTERSADPLCGTAPTGRGPHFISAHFHFFLFPSGPFSNGFAFPFVALFPPSSPTPDLPPAGGLPGVPSGVRHFHAVLLAGRPVPSGDGPLVTGPPIVHREGGPEGVA